MYVANRLGLQTTGSFGKSFASFELYLERTTREAGEAPLLAYENEIPKIASMSSKIAYYKVLYVIFISAENQNTKNLTYLEPVYAF